MKRLIIAILYYIICLLDTDFDMFMVENLKKAEKLKKMNVKFPRDRSEALDFYLELAKKGLLEKNGKRNFRS
jgi:hypothetical protein